MYSANQLDCLNALNIRFYDLKDKPQQGADDVNVFIAPELITDLQVLFPELIQHKNAIELKTGINWVFSSSATNLEKSPNQLTSPEFSELSVDDRREIADWLGELLQHKS